MCWRAEQDQEYQDLVDTVLQDKPTPAGFKSCKQSLSVDNGLVLLGQRLIVPKAMRKEVLCRLHASHQGMEKTLRRARQAVYWPGITADIKSTVEACHECQFFLPSQGKEPLERDPQPTRKFQEMAADFFEIEGKHHLVVVDRYSGYPFVHSFSRPPTAESTITTLHEIFATTGYPQRLFSDGGLQFTAEKTQTFLKKHGIDMRLSTPGYAQSNGLAESSVKAVKHLLQKCKGKPSDFNDGLLELRNSPRLGGKSPNELILGHPARSRVPAHERSFQKAWLVPQEVHDQKTAQAASKAADHYDKSSKTLHPLEVGESVLVQNQSTLRWDRKGTIVRIGRSRDYQLKMENGRYTWRNRRFLRPNKEMISPDGLGEEEEMRPKKQPEKPLVKKQDKAEEPKKAAEEESPPRRSKRVRIAPQRYGH